uniref:Uncharacterized protein n=1 Tax=Chenopodium quinoa TaxID=63459 RepID=A0A803N3F8_CHEQI
FMDNFEELSEVLCIAHIEEDDISSHKLELLVGKLENPFGILDFVRGLKDEVTREDEMFRYYAKIGKKEEKRKLGKKGKRKERDGGGDGCVLRCISVRDITKKEKDVAGKSLNSEEGKVNPIDPDHRPNIIDNNSDLKSASETKNPNLTGSIIGFVTENKDFISIRVLDPPKKMDYVKAQEVFTPMEISHPPVKGHDRCETTPNLAQDSTIDMVDQVSSCESTSVPLPVAPVCSPLKSAASHNNSSSQNLMLLVSSRRLRTRRKSHSLRSLTSSAFTNSLFCRMSGSKRKVFYPTEIVWLSNRKLLYGSTPDVLMCTLVYD